MCKLCTTLDPKICFQQKLHVSFHSDDCLLQDAVNRMFLLSKAPVPTAAFFYLFTRTLEDAF